MTKAGSTTAALAFFLALTACDGGEGPSDAGAFDAGTTDAGAFDAGAFDAGVTDAGLIDTDGGAAGGDAGVIDDAGATDAGSLDAGVLGSCGDAIIDDGEECDDGNIEDNDDCSAVCIVEFCGDDVCQDIDTCATCVADCGPCADAGATDAGTADAGCALTAVGASPKLGDPGLDGVQAVVNLVNTNVTLVGLIAALADGYVVDATISMASAQPAGPPNNPRIFLYVGNSTLSIVPSAKTLELGSRASESEQLFAEFEIGRTDHTLYGVLDEGGTCSGCHVSSLKPALTVGVADEAGASECFSSLMNIGLTSRTHYEDKAETIFGNTELNYRSEAELGELYCSTCVEAGVPINDLPDGRCARLSAVLAGPTCEPP